METRELRILEHKIELRKLADGKQVIHGVAAVFNSLSRVLGYFRERILPGAFEKCDMSDVSCLFNHDSNMILARSFKGEGTLSLSISDAGLEYEFEVPDHVYGAILCEALTRGDVRHSSFAFTVGSKGDNFIENPNEGLIREINHFSAIYDVSPVINPAYLQTEVDIRSMKEFEETKSKNFQASIDKMRLEHYKR